MNNTLETRRADFGQAMGESFSDAIVPPVDFEDASAHECCEVIWAFLGSNVTPRHLAQLTDAEVAALSRKFGKYFECDSPSVEKLKVAIARTLARWPVGSLGK